MSSSGDKVVVQVDTLESGLSTNTMNLYLGVGIPEGYTELDAGISFEPKLLSLSTNTGSSNGSLITAVIKGVGINDKVTLVNDSTGDDFC